MSNIDKHALNQEKIEWLNKLADMEYCKSNPGHWLMSLKDTNMLAQLALHSQALLDELEASEKLNAELMEKQRLIDICQGQGLEHRIAAEKRAEAAEKRIAELPGQKRLIGWRMADYTDETADPALAKNWATVVGVLPIFEGDVNTKLSPAAAGKGE